MMVFRCMMLCLVSAVWADTNDTALPNGVSEDVRHAFESASQAVRNGDPTFAQALMKGVLLSGGVSLRVDASSVRFPYQEQAIADAVDVWGSHLGEDMPVTIGTDPRQCQVVVKFVHELPERSDSLGKISLTRNYRWNSKKCEVTFSGEVYIVNRLEGEWLTQEQVRDVAMHEIGHMLGLGDSEVAGTLMGELIRERPAPGPNEHEVADVVALRRFARQRLTEMRRGA